MAWKTIQQNQENKTGWKTIQPASQQSISEQGPEPDKNSWAGRVGRFVKELAVETAVHLGTKVAPAAADVITRLSPIEGIRGQIAGAKEVISGPKAMPALERFQKGVSEFQARPTFYERASKQTIPTISGTLPEQIKGLAKSKEARGFVSASMESPTLFYGSGAGLVAGAAGKGLATRVALRSKAVVPEALVQTGIQSIEEGDLKNVGRNLVANALLMSGISNIVGEIKLPKNLLKEKLSKVEVETGKLSAIDKKDIEDAFKQGIEPEAIIENVKKIKSDIKLQKENPVIGVLDKSKQVKETYPKKEVAEEQLFDVEKARKDIVKKDLPYSIKIKEKPYGYEPKSTTSAISKTNPDSEYNRASSGVGAEIINSVPLNIIKKIYDKKIKKGDIVETIDAVRKINGSVAYANAKFIENKKLSNAENFSGWFDIFKNKLDAPNDRLDIHQKKETQPSYIEKEKELEYVKSEPDKSTGEEDLITKKEVETKPEEKMKVRSAAKTLEARAIEAGFKGKFKNLPEYKQMNLKKVSEKISDIDENTAERIAMTGKDAPEGVLPELVLDSVSKKASKEKNFELIENLAVNSALIEEATEFGRRIRAWGEISPHSAVKVIGDIVKKRKGKNIEVDKRGKEMIDKAKKTTKPKITMKEVGDLLDNLICK